MHAKHPDATIDVTESGFIRCSLENKRHCPALLSTAILNELHTNTCGVLWIGLSMTTRAAVTRKLRHPTPGSSVIARYGNRFFASIGRLLGRGR
jgi:hypothetical protein